MLLNSRLVPNSQSGTTSLLSLVAICGAMVLAMLLSDLSRWVGAQSALDQAAKATMRCLTASDSECVETSVRNGTGERDWYLRTEGARQITWADRYLYRAWVTEQRWQLAIPGYEIHKVPFPNLRVSGARVPTRIFSRSYNNFERRLLRVSASGTRPVERLVPRYVPRFEPNYPSFDEELERVLDQAPAEMWTPVTSQDSPLRPIVLPFSSVQSGVLRLLPGETARFYSPIVAVPALDASETTACDDGGRSCRGGEFQTAWRTEAALAIKAFGTVVNASGPVRISWTDRLFGNGLAVEVWTADEMRHRNPDGSLPPPQQVICLGGRTVSETMRRFPAHYHLWLRGPRDSNGGSHAICPGGRVAHWPLLVERGGAFRIRGSLESNGGSAVAAVTMDLRWYFDDYVNKPVGVLVREPFACQTEQELQRTVAPLPACPAAELCGLPEGSTVDKCFASVEAQPVCGTAADAGDTRLFPVPELRCGTEMTAAVCDDSWHPAALDRCDPVAGRSVCPIAVRDAEPLIVSRFPNGCPLASQEPLNAPCFADGRETTFRPSGDYGPVEQCPELAGLIERNRAQAQQLLASQPEGAPQFEALSVHDLSWDQAREFEPPLWRGAVAPTDERGATLADPATVRAATVRFDLPAGWLKRRSGDKPSIDDFNLSLNGAFQEIPELKEEIRRELTGAYPFTGLPEFEVPTTLPTGGATLCGEKEGSRDEILRVFASTLEPSLHDADVELATESSYLDTVIVNEQSACGERAPGPIVPIRPCSPIHSAVVEYRDCAPPEYLGRFSETLYPDGPQVCVENPHRCTSEIVASSVPHQSDPRVLPSAAIALGYRELARLLGAAPRSGCAGADHPVTGKPDSGKSATGCARIEVSKLEEGTPQVEATVELPLSSALATLVGSDSLTVRTFVTERRETARLRRSGGDE